MVDPSSSPPSAAPGDAVERTRHALSRMGAPQRLAEPLVTLLGPGAAEELAADPWRLLALGSVTPRQADFCARALLGEAARPDDPRRGLALAAHLLHRASRDGHTAIDRDRLAGALRALGVRPVEPVLAAAAEDDRMLVFEVVPDVEGDEFGDEAPEMPDPELFFASAALGAAEQRLGAGLARLTSGEPVMDSATAAETVQAAAQTAGREASPEVTAAMVTAALRGLSVLVHGPGSAETVADVVRYTAAIAQESRTGLVAAAPTARGAAALNQRLDGSGVSVQTVAALLATAQPVAPGGLMVVVDATALDTETAAALVDLCGTDSHLVLVADPAQLPSAGPGQVVADLVASRVAAVAALPGDPDPGPQVLLAAEVGDGELASQVHAPGREVVLVPAASAGEAAHRALQLVTDSIPRTFGLATEQVQIITTERGGEAGAAAVNTACKTRFNPGPGAVAGLDPGDRVLLAGHGPGYAPGDTGVLRAVDETGPRVELADGRAVTVARPAHLRPGWAIPLAAALGSTWPAAVLLFTPGAALSRPAVYTALTRGERHVSIVNAAGAALAEAVQGTASVHRHTRLVQLVREG